MEVIKQNPLTKGVDDFEANPWTVLKLWVLMLYVPLYTSIISRYYPNMVYVDLFAGSGLCRYKGSKVPVVGSSLIALSFAKKSFTTMFFNDISPAKIKYLEKRLNSIKEVKYGIQEPYFKFTYLDANDATESVIHEIEDLKQVHGLVFIDSSRFGI
jgi:three-Cys-motif partner protein